MSRACDRHGVTWPPLVYGPPRAARRCGWCDRTDDAVAFGYDDLPPACPDHQPDRLDVIADLATLRTSGQWTKVRAPDASAQRVYDAGVVFARGGTDDGWTMWPRRREPAPSDGGGL